MSEIRKKLSANDVGATGGHQAGILVPKDSQILDFFPRLDRTEKNPRMAIVMIEKLSASRWEFNFIYYNNAFFGGTRNEFRLTRMTRYLRSVNAKISDELVFSRNRDQSYVIDLKRHTDVVREPGAEDVLVLSGGWKIVNIKH